MKCLELLIAILLVINVVVVTLYEEGLKKEAAKLKQRLNDLTECEPIYMNISKNIPPAVQLIQLKMQAEHLGFCTQCRLYQDKVKQDSLQKTEIDQT